jgi:FAD/FMN-containing dehydrogenase
MLVDQPSKLCQQVLSCAFTDCYNPDLLSPGDNSEKIFSNTADSLKQSDELVLPIRVVQPVSVGDVVTSMKWAYENKVPVSVKTGGNNWGGASAGGGTLSINTRSVRYVPLASLHST